MLGHLLRLKVLGIHGLRLHSEHLIGLGLLCGTMKSRLQCLAVALIDWQFSDPQSSKYGFFEAVGVLDAAEVLCMPQFADFVGEDVSALSRHETLRSILTVLVSNPLSQKMMS